MPSSSFARAPVVDLHARLTLPLAAFTLARTLSPTCTQPFFPSSEYKGKVEVDDTVKVTRVELIEQKPVRDGARPIAVYWLELADNAGYVFDRFPLNGKLAFRKVGEMPAMDSDSSESY